MKNRLGSWTYKVLADDFTRHDPISSANSTGAKWTAGTGSTVLAPSLHLYRAASKCLSRSWSGKASPVHRASKLTTQNMQSSWTVYATGYQPLHSALHIDRAQLDAVRTVAVEQWCNGHLRFTHGRRLLRRTDDDEHGRNRTTCLGCS
jgi:hypothetical protein